MEWYKKNDDSLNISQILANLGNAYFTKGDIQSANDYYIQSMCIAQALNDEFTIYGISVNYGADIF